MQNDKKYKVDNAVIMAAGMSTRLAPLSYETPKALLNVHGEVLIERQIRQLREAGIEEILDVYKRQGISVRSGVSGIIDHVAIIDVVPVIVFPKPYVISGTVGISV